MLDWRLKMTRQSEAGKKFWNSLSVEERNKHVLKVHSPERLQKLRNTWDKKLLQADFNSLGYDSKRRRIILEQNSACTCGLKEWFGKPLSLEIDHINGNNIDHSRENMVALCPNCHSITDTWRGRNKTKQVLVSDEQIVEASKTQPNIRKLLLHLGLAPKGTNYKRIKTLLNMGP